ncbi:MAG: PEGA domain-containing protein [Myxococcota bacterium]
MGTGLPAVAIAQPSEVPDAPASSDDADAPNTRAAILPLVVEGDEMPEADQQQLTGKLVEGLQRGDFEVAEPGEVVAAVPSAGTCSAAECYAEIAKATDASHIVRAVVHAEDRDYRVEMSLADGATGFELATAEDSCQICGVAEVGDLIDAAAATLRTKLDALAQGPATLIVSSNPEGAQVSIDGELKGTTPFDAPVIPGKHVLRISKDGFITVEREVTFVEGIEESQSFELEKVPSRLPSRPWGWVSLGAGIAGLGAATGFAVIGQMETEFTLGGSCDSPDAAGNCPEIWNTEAIVLGTAIAGAALTTLGVAILLNSSRRRKGSDEGDATTARRRRLQFGAGPGSVSLRGRF